ncbi:hypothetical protein BS47DRAFT_1365946 [Hydnum rufescens UP504]|uniref:Uncharacterized protein n=1 Tax=Hydnum rufescens UP504 TaxID=1448309 RepID=A0A9P6DN04_9AGAM|nr:hypothetical protein BS47DRAFT_1365946 [Hydnum rufescens UP504]
MTRMQCGLRDFSASELAHILVIYQGHQARDGATYLPGRSCVALLDPFSLRETPAELSTDEAQGEIRGHAQPPRTPTLAYPQPPQQQIKYGAAHPLQRVCGNPGLGPFSLHETDPKNAQTTSTAKYRSTQPPKTPTRTLYDNETSTAPHTRFSGCVAILGQAQGQTRECAAPQTARPSSTRNLHDESNTVPDARFGGCLAQLGSFSLHQTRQGQNTGTRAATQDPNLRLPMIYMNQTRCHTPAEAGLPSLQHMKPYCREPKSANPPGSPARKTLSSPPPHQAPSKTPPTKTQHENP